MIRHQDSHKRAPLLAETRSLTRGKHCDSALPWETRDVTASGQTAEEPKFNTNQSTENAFGQEHPINSTTKQFKCAEMPAYRRHMLAQREEVHFAHDPSTSLLIRGQHRNRFTVDLWRKPKWYLVGKNANTDVQNHCHTIFCYKA